MRTFNLPPSQKVGQIKEAIKEAILDGTIQNDPVEAKAFMMTLAQKMNL